MIWGDVSIQKNRPYLLHQWAPGRLDSSPCNHPSGSRKLSMLGTIQITFSCHFIGFSFGESLLFSLVSPHSSLGIHQTQGALLHRLPGGDSGDGWFFGNLETWPGDVVMRYICILLIHLLWKLNMLKNNEYRLKFQALKKQ